MRNELTPESSGSVVVRVLVASFWWLVDFFLSFRFLLGVMAGLAISIPVVTSSIQQWADNGGVTELCSQFDNRE